MELGRMGLTAEQTTVIQTELDRLNEEISALKRRSEIDLMLYTSGAKNIKACSALIEDIKTDDMQILRQSVENQIKQLKADEKTSFLFYDIKSGRKGFVPAESTDIKNRQLTYEELCRIM